MTVAIIHTIPTSPIVGAYVFFTILFVVLVGLYYLVKLFNEGDVIYEAGDT